MASYQRGAIFTGARCIFTLKGQKVGFAHGVTLTEEILHEPVDVLDSVFTEEYAPTGVRVAFTAQLFRLVGASLRKFGFWPAADHVSVITMGELDATIRDHVTQQTLAHIQRCRCSSLQLEVSSRGIAGINTSWNAIRVLDESGT